MFSVRRPSPRRLAQLAADQAGRDLTYTEVGATSDDLPAGYRHQRHEADLGPFEPEVFGRAAAALRDWQVQRRAGLAIYPGDPVRTGATFVLTIAFPVAFVTAAGRIVRVTDEPDQFGFAYGTLPGHPERGEEAFDLMNDDGRLVFRVVAFSQQRHPAARLALPIARWIQSRVNQRYLTAMRDIAADSGGGRP